MQFAPVHSRVCQLGKVLLQRRGLRLWHGWGPPLASFRLAAAAYARPCRLSGLVTSSTFHAFTCVCPTFWPMAYGSLTMFALYCLVQLGSRILRDGLIVLAISHKP